MDKERSEKRVRLAKIIVALCFVIIVISLYLGFIYSEKCDSYACFRDNLRTCSRAQYVNEEPESTWQYNIIGKRTGQCVVDVKLIQAKQGSLELEKLNGLEMSCYYLKNFPAYPEQDLEKCHGVLKEEIQKIIIKKLNSYIIENIDEISGEIAKLTENS
jgi:hypothetical protein